jgi:hypothetical protein
MRRLPIAFIFLTSGCAAPAHVIVPAPHGTSPAAPASAAAASKAPCPYAPSPALLAEFEKGDFAIRGDSELPTCDVPPSSFVVHTLDAGERPVAGVPLTVGQYDGDSGALTPLMTGVSDAQGRAPFAVPPGNHYAVTALYQGGRFAGQFMVPSAHGVDVRLHIVSTTKDVSATKVVITAVIYVQRKGDWLEVEQEFGMHNFGANALLLDESFALPNDAEALHLSGFPENVHAEIAPGRGVRIVDTVAPRRHEAWFSWRVPVVRGKDRVFELELPQRTAQAQVVYLADDPTMLVVAGAPMAEIETSNSGEKVAVSTRRFDNDGQRHVVRFTVRNKG